MSTINRRLFVRNLAAAAALFGGLGGSIKSAFSTPIVSSRNIPDSEIIAMGLDPEVISVSLIASLFDNPVTVRLHFGVMSDVVTLGTHGSYRIRVTKTGKSERFDIDLFQFELADSQGHKLASIGLADGATGTFTQYGVQGYVNSDRLSASLRIKGETT